MASSNMSISKHAPQSWARDNLPFHYRLLSSNNYEIRLLQLDPASLVEDAGTTLRCTIQHVALQDRDLAVYHAISYCWGKNPEPEEIIIDGTKVTVPDSAVAAIRGTHQNQQGEPVPVWIDAICINQLDNAEKSQQVAMMDQVYSKATEVLVWLGEDAGDTAGAATRLIRDFVEWSSAFESKYGLSPEMWDPTYGKAVEAVKNFFNRGMTICDPRFMIWDCPWFERVWAIQEVVLARHAICFRGTHSFDWDDIGRLGDLALRVLWLSDTINRLKSGMKTRCRGTIITNIAVTRSWCKLGAPDFTHLLNLSRGSFLATDPRDKVYGILGLLKDGSPRILPDYFMSVREVYVQATVIAMEWNCSSAAREEKRTESKTLRLELLAEAQRGSRITRYQGGPEGAVDSEGCPSWVPRYDLPVRWSEGAPGYVTPRAASAEIDPGFSIDLQKDVLQIKGCMVGIVDGTRSALRAVTLGDMEPFHEGSDALSEAIPRLLPRYAERLVEIFALVGERCGPWTTRNLAKIAHGLLLGQYEGRRAGQRALSAFSALVLDLKKCVIDTCSLPSDEFLVDHGARDGESKDFFRHFFLLCGNRVPFMTDNDHFGLAPLFCEQGDAVCILYGCPVPLIMRRQGQYWHVIGDAYVHDIMDGEYIEQLLANGSLRSETQWFGIN